MIDVGIVGVGTYLPEKTMKAAEIAGLTNGVWSEDAVINKLGIKQRYLPCYSTIGLRVEASLFFYLS